VRRNALPILVTLVGACLIGLLIYGVTAQGTNRTLDEQVAKGELPVAPNATSALPVIGATGSSSLASLRGKVVLLNFWAAWCTACQEEAPMLERAQSALQRHNSTILGVTYEDAAPDSQTFMRQYKVTYPNLRDSTGSFVHGAYGTSQLPESFIVNRQGRIVAIERGPIDQKFVNRALALAASSS
jgi:cytochrome c biogenesis protein CcmG/thiol:disulfide interchange protein DsbE